MSDLFDNQTTYVVKERCAVEVAARDHKAELLFVISVLSYTNSMVLPCCEDSFVNPSKHFNVCFVLFSFMLLYFLKGN